MSVCAVFGLSMRLPFRVSQVPLAESAVSPNLEVQEGNVPRSLESPIAADKQWQAENGKFLWKGGNRSARFLVEQGKRVTVQKARCSDDRVMAIHFFSGVVAAALRQSGALVLHASCILTPSGAVAICGQPGAGKSTTVAACLKRGCKLVSDDLTVLRRGYGGGIEVSPGLPHLSLCNDAVRFLRLAYSRERPGRRGKVIVATENLVTRSVGLSRLYVLRQSLCGPLCIRQVQGREKFDLLHGSVYGPLLPAEQSTIFALLAATHEQTAVYEVTRPMNSWTVDSIAEAAIHG